MEQTYRMCSNKTPRGYLTRIELSVPFEGESFDVLKLCEVSLTLAELGEMDFPEWMVRKISVSGITVDTATLPFPDGHRPETVIEYQCQRYGRLPHFSEIVLDPDVPNSTRVGGRKTDPRRAHQKSIGEVCKFLEAKGYDRAA